MKAIYYNMGDGVEAFSTYKDAVLPYFVIQPHQVHGDAIKEIKSNNIDREKLRGIDALVTNLVECPIAVRTADCVPILLYDPVCKAIAAVHSGWRGTVAKLVVKVIQFMGLKYGTKAIDLKVVIGPSIGPESFIVHKDVVVAFSKAGFFMNEICKVKEEDTYTIDLWEANKKLLLGIGVLSANITITGICTYKNHNDFFSARYEKNNKCGRTINVIKLNRE